MNDEELSKIWVQLHGKITKINDRTKGHTIKIKLLEQRVKELETKLNKKQKND